MGRKDVFLEEDAVMYGQSWEDSHLQHWYFYKDGTVKNRETGLYLTA